MMGETAFVSGADALCQTAGTDGINEMYNRDFLATLCDGETRFLVLHEGMHKILRHMFVWRALADDNAKLANIAMDAVINNQYLMGKEGLKFPTGGVDMPQYADSSKWNAKSIFEDLKKNGAGKQTSTDYHDWEAAKALTPEQAKEVEKQIDTAIRQAALTGAGLPRGVEAMLVPEVDWKMHLAEFVKAQCAGADKQTWRKPHRTYIAYDLYMPTPYADRVGKLLLCGDTSGSIGDRELSHFLGHMQHLCDEVNPDGIDLAWWDTEIRGVDVFTASTMGCLAAAVKPKGGGGTDPRCITEWLTEQRNEYVCAVVVTDGEFDTKNVGDWGALPVLWLVVNNSSTGGIASGVTIRVRELSA
jgi:predicted metal-dependent peptidase